MSYQVNIVLKKYWKHAEPKKGGPIELYYYSKNITMQQNIKCKKKKKSITCCTDEAGIQPNATHSKHKRKNIEH